jgi:hypothetical protein
LQRGSRGHSGGEPAHTGGEINAAVAQIDQVAIDVLGPVSLEAERACVGRQAETAAAPICYVAELVGDTYSKRAILWLIALMVPCCDPLAIALTAAGSADCGMETRLNDVRHLLDRASVEGE